MVIDPGLLPNRITTSSITLALTSISRLSTLTGASCRALRYYEEVGLLRPARTAAGKRLFSPHQCDVATAIVLMRRLDVPVSEIRLILDCVRSDRERLADLRDALEARAATLAKQLEEVNITLGEWFGSGRFAQVEPTGQLDEARLVPSD